MDISFRKIYTQLQNADFPHLITVFPEDRHFPFLFASAILVLDTVFCLSPYYTLLSFSYHFAKSHIFFFDHSHIQMRVSLRTFY